MKLLDKLKDTDERVLRHVHPNFVKGGRLTSEAFFPTKVHEFMLSVHRASLTSASGCYREYIGHGKKSVGVMAVTVGECDECIVPVVHAPTDPSTDPLDEWKDASHSVIDFRSLPSKGARERTATSLRDFAKRRGYLFPQGVGAEHGVDDCANGEAG